MFKVEVTYGSDPIAQAALNRRVHDRLIEEVRSRLHLREFAKNSRIFAAFALGANRALQFFFPRKSGSRNSTGIPCADTPSTKGDP